MFETPILFLIFNRPDVTAVTLEKIRGIKPSKLYVAADGPRVHKAGEAELCEQTRSLIKTIDWPCEVKTLFREQNLGCGKAVSQAITWFFEQEEAGIILEDDCLPDLSFFKYCKEMLAYYKNDERVMHIGGSNFVEGQVEIRDSYYFSALAHVWGWATWRRAWQEYDFDMKDFYLFVRQKKIYNYYPDKTLALYWLDTFQKMYYKKIDTWDYQWVFAIYNNCGVSVVPEKNLISNIGFGVGATHTNDAGSVYANKQTSPIQLPLRHPAVVKTNQEIDLYYFKKVDGLSLLNVQKRSLLRRVASYIRRSLNR